MNRRLATLALFFLLFLTLAGRAAAEGDPPEETGWIGTVTGQVTNGTAGGRTPGGLSLMLHAWEGDSEMVMLDGALDDSGAFRFETVPMEEDWVFAAMLSYGDLTFYSETVELGPGMTEVALPLTVYETTADPAAVTISQLHTLLDFTPGEVLVSQVYILSNPTDRAIAGGLTLAEGQTATLQFALPAGANKLKFEGDGAGARFVVTPDGFADTAAVMPGDNTAQVIVTYSLPYSSGMTLGHGVYYPAETVNFMVRADSAVALAGTGLRGAERQELAPGMVVDIYGANPLASGGAVAATLTGEPVYRAPDHESGAMGQGESPVPGLIAEPWALPAAGGLVGVALISAGLWLWRRSSTPEEDRDLDTEWTNALRAIATLDDAHDRGEIAAAQYRRRRAELCSQAKVILQARQGGASE